MTTLFGNPIGVMAGLGAGAQAGPMKIMRRLSFEHYRFIAMPVALVLLTVTAAFAAPLLSEDWSGGSIDPAKWDTHLLAVQSATAQVLDAGGGDLALKITIPDWGDGRGILYSVASFPRGDNLRCTFTAWHGADYPHAKDPVVMINGPFWRVKGVDFGLESRMNLAGGLAWGPSSAWPMRGMGWHEKYDGTWEHFGPQLEAEFQNAWTRAVSKATSLRIQVILGDKAGGTGQWSTDRGVSWHPFQGAGGTLIDTRGQAAGAALKAQFSLGALGGTTDYLTVDGTSPVYLGFCPGANILWLDDIVVEKGPLAATPQAAPEAQALAPLKPLALSNIHLEGWLAERVARSEKKMRELRAVPIRLERPAELGPGVVWPGHWGADFAGRWFEATTYMEEYGLPSFDQKPRLHALLKYQQADGPISDQRDWMSAWGDHRGLLGLALMAERGDAEALAGAKKLAQYYAGRYAAGDWVAMGDFAPPGGTGCPLGGLVALYRVTKDPQCLDTARKIAAHTMLFLQITGHGHGLQTSCRGVLDLAELTGESKYLNYVKRIWEGIHEAAYVSGSFPEGVPDSTGNEACATADWLQLNLDLWRLTREDRFLDYAERAVFNGLPFDQSPDGGFVTNRDLRGRVGATADQCCSYSGARALMKLAQNVYNLEQTKGMDYPIPVPGVSKVYVNFFVSSRAKLALADGEAALTQSGDYPAGENIALAIESAQPAAFEIHLRIPDSARREGLSAIKLNGEELPTERMGNWVILRPPQGKWGTHDQVSWRCPVPLHTVKHIFEKTGKPEVTFWHGPLLLACVDTRMDPPPAGAFRLLDLKQACQPYELDRSIRAQTPLKIGEKTYKHGLGMTARTKINFILGEGCQTFLADVGVDNNPVTANKKGVIGVDVVVDGKTRFAGPVQYGGEPPIPVRVDLTGSQRLTLTAGLMALGPSEGDWGDARIQMKDGKEIYLSDVIRQYPPITLPGVSQAVAADPGQQIMPSAAKKGCFKVAYTMPLANSRRGAMLPLACVDPASPGLCVWFDELDSRGKQ